MDYVAIDFETANEKRSSACALGIVVVKNGRISDKASWLIRPPEGYFRPFNTRVHGIRMEDVAHEPTFRELWTSIKPYIHGKTVIAHNAGFDIGVLKGTLDAHSLQYPKVNYLCTVGISRRTWPGLKNYKLNNIAEHLGIRFTHHDAREDAFACAEIARRACMETGTWSLGELAKQLGVSTGKVYPNSQESHSRYW